LVGVGLGGLYVGFNAIGKVEQGFDAADDSDLLASTLIILLPNH